MSRMGDLRAPHPRRLLDDDRGAPRARRDPALQRLLLQGVRPRRRRTRRHRPRRGHPRRRRLDRPRRRPGLALLTAAYATRLWLLAFRGRGAEAPDHGRQPVAMTTVLWVLAVPSLAFGGLAYGSAARLVRRPRPRPRPSPPPSSAPEWPSSAASSPTEPGATPPPSRPASRWAPSPPTRTRTRGLVEAEAIATHTPAYGDIAAAPDPADPGRLLLGPLHRHAAVGFHLDAAVHGAVRPPGPGRRHASSASWTARSSTPTYAARAPCPACSAPPYAAPRPATSRPTSSALLAGTVVLAVAVRPRRHAEREQA